MISSWYKSFAAAFVMIAGLFWMAGITASPAAAWPVKCAQGYTVQKLGSGNNYRCRKRDGNRYTYKKGKCFIPTPYLTKHTHLGRNYACGVQVGTTQVWNKFVCTGGGYSGYSALSNASAKRKTCRKSVPKYTYTKPTF